MGFASAALVEAEFYRALSNCDIEAMRAIWSQTEAVTCVHPLRAPLIDYDRVIASWAEIFAAQGTTRILSEQLHRSDWPDGALHVVKEYIEIPGTTDKPVPVVATNAYCRNDAGWQMVLHHGSPLQRVLSPAGRVH